MPPKTTHTPCGREDCFYELEKKEDSENFFNSKLLKLIGVVYGIASPFFVWLVISIFEINSEVKLIKQKQEVFNEVQQDIKEIKFSLVDLRIKVGKMEQKVDIK